MNLQAVLEGLLFVVGDEGLTINQMCEIMNITEEEAKTLILTLKTNYEAINRGLRINYLGNTFKLTTKKEHKEYFERLIENPGTNMLSQAALETLAIVAYNEPVTRAMVSDIRGVDCSQIMRKLAAKGLIKEIGRSDLPGRPITYETTNEFLDYFNLSSIEDLPKLKDHVTLENVEADLFESRYKEPINNE